MPKPHTPFQWAAQCDRETVDARLVKLRDAIRGDREYGRAIGFRYHDGKPSIIEGLLSRGDRRVGAIIEAVWWDGGRFDGWSEHFSYERWAACAERCLDGTKPGSRYSPSDSQSVIPDVYIIKTDEGYKAVLNEDGLPQLRISPVYRRLLDKGGENSDETRAYVKDKFKSALWLLKSVDQRQKTILKVSTSIITFQRAFLDSGIEHLRPLVLRDVANDIGMHESTVSRVVNNKYMHTPQGVFELKYFFHSGISSSFGESVSSVTIKQRIRRIIEAEDAKRPLSDSKIMNILQKEGLVLARRTIAKYREELKIPTSNQRKVVF